MAPAATKLSSFLLLSPLLTLCSSLQFSFASTPPSSKPSVYELLPKFGLPSGLLPDSVTNYKLAEDGRFEVTLEKPCYIKFEYEVYYHKKISGVLNIGSITELKGIQVKKHFLWFDVVEIRVDLPPSNGIYFKVGFINEELDVHQFLTVHSCKDKAVSLRQVVEMPELVNDNPMIVPE